MEYVALIHNIMLSWTLKKDITSEEAWTGNKPSVTHLWVFGCDAYILVLKAQHWKLNPKILKCTLISYILNHKAYHLVYCSSGWIIESWNVVFDKGNTYYEHVSIDSEGDDSLKDEEIH